MRSKTIIVLRPPFKISNAIFSPCFTFRRDLLLYRRGLPKVLRRLDEVVQLRLLLLQLPEDILETEEKTEEFRFKLRCALYPDTRPKNVPSGRQLITNEEFSYTLIDLSEDNV